jgi:hypothetical protein
LLEKKLMTKTSALQNMRRFFTKNYQTALHTRKEYAMDTLLGTMIGVLFLAVITASFAGIYMAYVVSSAKSSENTARAAAAAKFSATSLNRLYVDSASGKTAAQTDGWTVTTQGTTPLSTADTATNAAYADYTFAATKPLKTGGVTPVSQWGVLVTSGNDRGLVKLYTAIPKAGQSQPCNWKQSPENMQKYCVVVYDVLASVVAPPRAYNIYPDVHWQDSVSQMPWTSTPDFSGADWKSNIGTQMLGNVKITSATANADGTKNLRFVALVKDLTPGYKVSLDFRKPGDNSFYAYTFTPTAKAGETGTLTRAVYGTINVPSGVDSVDVYMDTKVEATQNSTTDPKVQISRFFLYQTKTS